MAQRDPYAVADRIAKLVNEKGVVVTAALINKLATKIEADPKRRADVVLKTIKVLGLVGVEVKP